MKFLFKSKDGGSESNVTGYWLFESKSFGSIVLLCFSEGTREAYHNHAFNALSWVLSGELYESVMVSPRTFTGDFLKPSVKPVYTSKSRMHKVFGEADKTWVLSFRGPWDKTWKEYLPKEDREITLTNGRVEVK